MYTLEEQRFWQTRAKKDSPRVYPGRMRGRAKKTGPAKKEWQVGQDNNSRSKAADGGAGACTGADGAVVLNVRRGPGAYALLLRADGQLTGRASTTTSTWACGLPARTSTATSPSSRGAQQLHSAAQGLCASAGRKAPLTKQGFVRNKYVPGPRPVITTSADWLPVNELAGQQGTGAPHGEAGCAAGKTTRELAGPGRLHPAALGQATFSTLSTGWSAPRARTTGT